MGVTMSRGAAIPTGTPALEVVKMLRRAAKPKVLYGFLAGHCSGVHEAEALSALCHPRT
jgi:hypothetical protein